MVLNIKFLGRDSRRENLSTIPPSSIVTVTSRLLNYWASVSVLKNDHLNFIPHAMQDIHVKFASTNIYISDYPPQKLDKCANIPNTRTARRHATQTRKSWQNVTPPTLTSNAEEQSPSDMPKKNKQIYSQIRIGSEKLLRFPLSSNPAALFSSDDLVQPATNPKRDVVTLFYPPLEVWEVKASNSSYITVADVLMKIYERKTRFPPNGVFSGLLYDDEDDSFMMYITD